MTSTSVFTTLRLHDPPWSLRRKTLTLPTAYRRHPQTQTWDPSDWGNTRSRRSRRPPDTDGGSSDGTSVSSVQTSVSSTTLFRPQSLGAEVQKSQKRSQRERLRDGPPTPTTGNRPQPLFDASGNTEGLVTRHPSVSLLSTTYPSPGPTPTGGGHTGTSSFPSSGTCRPGRTSTSLCRPSAWGCATSRRYRQCRRSRSMGVPSRALE